MPGKLTPSPRLVVGALGPLSLLFFWRITLLGEVVYWGTPLLQFSPWRQLAVDLYRSGQFPLWNPYVDFGAPLAANLQTAAFSPLNLFYLAVPVDVAMGYTIVLHVALAGVFMYGCSRALGLSPWGAALSALAYMFCGYLISRAGFLSMVAAVPWLPAVVAGTELTLRAQVDKTPLLRPALGLALATGFLLVAGHIQLALYILLVAVSYGVVRAFQLVTVPLAGGAALHPPAPSSQVWAEGEKVRGRTRPLPSLGGGSPFDCAQGKLRAATAGEGQWRPTPLVAAFSSLRLLLPVAGGLLLGIGLAGVQLALTAELTLHAARQAGPGYDLAMNYSLWPGQLVQLLAPDFFGNPASGTYRGPGNYWEGTSYVGIAPLLLALFAIRHGGHPARWYLVALTLVGLVFALGRFTPVYPWVFTHVPLFGLFQAPARFLLWTTFALVLLAGIGLDTLLARPDLPALRRWAAVTLAGAGGLGIGSTAALVVAGDMVGASLGSVLRAAVLLLATALLLMAARDPRRTWWPAAVCGLLVVDLFSFGMGLNPTTQREVYTAPWPPEVERLRATAGLDRLYTAERDFDGRFGQYLRFKDFGSSRWEDLMPLRATLLPNMGQAAGLHEVFNYDPLKLERSRLLRGIIDTAADPAPLLAMAGVRWVVDRNGVPQPAPQEPLPRAYRIPASGVVAVPDRTAAVALLQGGGFAPRRQVILEGAPTPAEPDQPAATRGSAEVVEYTAYRVAVRTVGAGPGVLVLTDSFYPGWYASIDGQPAALYAANVAFRGVPVPPGEHTVVFLYDPLSFTLGLGVSIVSLLGVLGLGAWAVTQRGKRTVD